MSFKLILLSWSVLSMELLSQTQGQRIRWEDEPTTQDNNYRSVSENETFERSTNNSGLVSKQYFHQQPFPPPNSGFHLQYSGSTFPSQSIVSKWEWSVSAKKPSLIQFPGENSVSPVSATSSIDTLKSSKRGSGPSIRIDENCQCGMIPFEKDTKKLQRIVGGIVSKENSWPWMVAIAYVGQSKPFWFCGGSLISDKFILTAAHCLRTIRNFGFANIKLIMGTNNLMDSKAATYYSIRAVRSHPLYKSGTEDYDIALLEVKENVNFTTRVSPICLTQEGHPFTNRTATVAGWGSLQNGESPPADLREVDLKVVPTTTCHKEYIYNYRTSITSAMICAWLPGKDSCQGDSGGPLFLKTTSEPFAYTQVYKHMKYNIWKFFYMVVIIQHSNFQYMISIGIVSFGPPQCGTTTIPGVYSRVASAIKWIKSTTAKNSKYCKGSF